MERLETLIDNLKSSYEAGVSIRELSSMVDSIRLELDLKNEAISQGFEKVNVWFPLGYRPEKNGNRSINEEVEGTPVEIAVAEEPEPIPSIYQATRVPEANTNQVPVSIPVAARAGLLGVPRPPLVTNEEHIDETAAENEQDDFLLPGNYHFRQGRNGNGLAEMERKSMHGTLTDEAPVVLELQLDEPPPVSHNNFEPKMRTERDIWANQNSTAFKMAEEPKQATRELNDILAETNGVSAVSTEKQPQTKNLADSLSGAKISDLKKGIAINDKFRFIKSLFRADDNLFERSVKTINNFNILQEAEYWMQRELVIKLGWNEEDELVQHFYSLVKRRFL